MRRPAPSGLAQMQSLRRALVVPRWYYLQTEGKLNDYN